MVLMAVIQRRKFEDARKEPLMAGVTWRGVVVSSDAQVGRWWGESSTAPGRKVEGWAPVR